jgi:hypothetical protein
MKAVRIPSFPSILYIYQIKSAGWKLTVTLLFWVKGSFPPTVREVTVLRMMLYEWELPGWTTKLVMELMDKTAKGETQRKT